MAQIDETIASYLTALKIEGKTRKTIESYANSLQDFRKVGCRLGLPETVDEYGVEQVYQFLGALQERGASPGYQHRRHREVQTLFSWCERMGMLDQNVFKRVPRVKVGEKIKPPFTSDEVNLLLQSQDRDNLRGCRNYAIILFLLDTGVRAAECISIRLEDVEWNRRRVFVRHAKGQKQPPERGRKTAGPVRGRLSRSEDRVVRVATSAAHDQSRHGHRRESPGRVHRVQARTTGSCQLRLPDRRYRCLPGPEPQPQPQPQQPQPQPQPPQPQPQPQPKQQPQPQPQPQQQPQPQPQQQPQPQPQQQQQPQPQHQHQHQPQPQHQHQPQPQLLQRSAEHRWPRGTHRKQSRRSCTWRSR